MRLNDKRILELLRTKHLNDTAYGIGLTRFREMREAMGLFRSRKQGHDVDSIREAMQRLRAQYPKAGQREISGLLFHEEDMSVPRSVITSYFAIYEPELVRQRRANRLKRKRFWAAGVNDLWAVDQHDKWKYKFGLALHSGLDPFIGRIHWLKIWWTNSNPRLILSFYLDTVAESGYMPLVSQSDPGVENFGLANGHTLLRHWHDPGLEGTLQHRWMNEKKNVMPEIGWSQLRHRWTPGFEDILDIGVNNGWYDPSNLLQALVFRWVFIPWLQSELDAYRNRVNNTAKRADKNKILPHGVPNHMYEAPEDFGVLDFKIKVDPESISHVRNLYAPPDHEVFELVPKAFADLAAEFYIEMGQPSVTRTNVWDIYMEILTQFLHLDNAHRVPVALDEKWGYALTMARDDYQDDIDLIPNLVPLRNGADVVGQDGTFYMGGVNNGGGLDDSHLLQLDEMMNRDDPLPEGEDDDQLMAWFSDEEDQATVSQSVYE
ncbi:hypothetical protein B0H15DRAFT_1003903 [Mycena belliarum]|uniref:Integrase core domain-containing protein n=1 Tax=Mycena belliarum TaxID=1033014 RepID=A0AAD6TS11_9AGAR|nr:hypothetical protein B0H15DRAFT_1003903 [Mycena belliae]